MVDRKTKKVEVAFAKQWNSNFPPIEAVDFVKWMNARLAEIPDQYMDSAIINIDSYVSHDEACATIRITYETPETDEEMADRALKENEMQARQKAGELRLLASLKAKYEGEQQ